MPRIDTAKIAAQQIASYPKEFASVISGREKQRIGDAAGLTQFGVNITCIKAGSASALRHWHEQEDEFIYMLEGTFDLQLGEAKIQAHPGDLVRMPMGVPHAYHNNTAAPTRALFWVSPAGRLKELFDALHDLTDIEEAMRLSALHEVDFVR